MAHLPVVLLGKRFQREEATVNILDFDGSSAIDGVRMPPHDFGIAAECAVRLMSKDLRSRSRHLRMRSAVSLFEILIGNFHEPFGFHSWTCSFRFCTKSRSPL